MRILSLVALLAIPALAADERNSTVQRLDEAAAVFEEVMAISDKAIPQDLLERAHCAVVVPGLKKGAFIIGGKFGRGFVSCRKKGVSGWSAPGAVRVEGGSVGFQIGGSETDVVMLVMNARGAEKLLATKFTVGGEGSAAAGPVGRTASAETDAAMRAEILTWSRSRGLFAGISLQGATLRTDEDANRDLYGRKVNNQDVILKGMPAPAASKKLLGLLNKYSPKELQ